MLWIAHVEGGPRRVNHTAVVIGHRIYSFGGYCSNEDYRSIQTIDVHVLNTETLRWSLIAPRTNGRGKLLVYPEVPFQRYGHTAVAYRHHVYMWGGRNDDVCCNILFCFDTRTHTWSKPEVTGRIPGVRDGHSACIVGSHMYIFGGFEEEINQFSCDVHCLNLTSMCWSYVETTQTPPSYRDFHTATVLDNRMYVFGGRGDRHSPFHTQEEIYCAQIVYLDLRTLEWHTPETSGDMPVGRRSHSAFEYGGRLMMFGGYNSILDRHFNELYAFDPATLRWSMVHTMGVAPSPRRRQVCLVLGKRMFLFGGTSPCDLYDQSSGHDRQLWDYNDVHVLDFEPSLKTLSMMTVIKHNLDMSDLPHNVSWEIRTMTTPNAISRPLNNTG